MSYSFQYTVNHFVTKMSLHITLLTNKSNKNNKYGSTFKINIDYDDNSKNNHIKTT